MRMTLISLLLALSCSGCAEKYRDYLGVRDHSKEFLKAKNGPRLLVPPHLNERALSKTYVLPSVHIEQPLSLLPPGSVAQHKALHKKANTL